MLTNNNSSSTRTNRSPFTPNQWQELEHQALIYKYMVSGVPIPTELIFSVKRSLESSLASRIFPHQSIGWGCYQVGFGRKTDPEPGRCRRTDGKKWRCSKEAYPDSKYCERHMHRGRNRSRKPVEQQQLNSNTSTSTSVTLGGGPLISSSSCNNNNNNNNLSASSTSPSPNSASPYSFSPLSSSPTAVIDHSQLFNTQNTNIRTTSDHFPYPHNSSSNSSSRPSVVAASGSSTHNLFLDSASATHVDHKDYRYFHGMTREGSSDEKSLFPESSGNIRSFQDSYNNLAMASSNNNYNKTFSQSQFETLAAAESTSKQQHDQQQQQQHCFVLGTDFKSSSTSTTRQIKLEKDSEKSLHHFFGEWPPKNNSSESWLDLSSTTSRLHSDG